MCSCLYYCLGFWCDEFRTHTSIQSLSRGLDFTNRVCAKAHSRFQLKINEYFKPIIDTTWILLQWKQRCVFLDSDISLHSPVDCLIFQWLAHVH